MTISEIASFCFDEYHEDVPGPKPLIYDGHDPETIIAEYELLLRNRFVQNPEKGYEMNFRRCGVNLCNHAIRFVHSREVAKIMPPKYLPLSGKTRLTRK